LKWDYHLPFNSVSALQVLNANFHTVIRQFTSTMYRIG
jgi:hypothetical protein